MVNLSLIHTYYICFPYPDKKNHFFHHQIPSSHIVPKIIKYQTSYMMYTRYRDLKRIWTASAHLQIFEWHKKVCTWWIVSDMKQKFLLKIHHFVSVILLWCMLMWFCRWLVLAVAMVRFYFHKGTHKGLYKTIARTLKFFQTFALLEVRPAIENTRVMIKCLKKYYRSLKEIVYPKSHHVI